MPKITMLKTDGSAAGEIVLSDDVFGVEVNETAIHEVVVAHLAAKRQGTQCTLTRSEVRGGGIKPWRQKGTGRARHGSIRSPQWTGGGGGVAPHPVYVAPKPRTYYKKVNKKVKKLAMLSALSGKVAAEDMIVLDALVLAQPKTKEMVGVLKNIGATKKALIITSDKDEAVVRASGNLPGVKAATTGELNVYDIVNADKLVITQDAAKRLEEVYA